jgi:predicted acylesterase/phospholipase RssA
MRVAYQAGVVRALSDHGLRFHHADGTSGGILNLAMLLSGLTPDEMCRRWTSLPVGDFISFLPLVDYVRSPHLPALGGAAGLTDKVFPHLGIDVDRIRQATGIEGTFNVCNYTRKVNEAVPHTDVDRDLLVAGISLPIFLPAVPRGDVLYMDSVWIRDANLMEAVRTGADELWLVWCIGNTSEYHDGPFNQFVHMIEISANGRLFEEFEQVRTVNERRMEAGRPPIRLHVVRPRFPLPLDPEYYLGRISGEDLAAMGYRDAVDYLTLMTPDGVALTPDATRMSPPPPGARFRETMTASGWDSAQLSECGASRREVAHESVDLRLLVETIDPDHPTTDGTIGRLCGSVSLPGLARDLPLDGGVLRRSSGRTEGAVELRYLAAFRCEGKPYVLDVRREHPSGVRRCRTVVSLRAGEAGGEDADGPILVEAELTESACDLARARRSLGLDRGRHIVEGIRALVDHGLRVVSRRRPG